MEIPSGPGPTSWESHCKVLRWTHEELTGSMPLAVRLELAAGGELSDKAYVDRAFHLRGDEADLRIHGTGLAFKVRALGPPDYVVTRREVLKELMLLPFRVLAFVLLAAVSLFLVIFFVALIFAPELFLPARPGF